MRSTMFAALLLVVPGALAAQAGLPVFAFGGRHLGDPRSIVGPQAECTSANTFGVVCKAGHGRLGATHVELAYFFRRDSLAGLSFRVDSGGFSGALRALQGRYGPPARLVRATGHDYAEWRFHDGRLDLTRTGSAENEVVIGGFAGSR